MNAILGCSIVIGSYAAIFGSAELMYHRWKIKGEITRKFVHLLSGVMAFTFPYLLVHFWVVLILGIGFFLVLRLSDRWGFLPSINDIDRASTGSLIFPFMLILAYFAYTYTGSEVYYYVPIMIVAFADAAAALVGERWKTPNTKIFGATKSIGGSLTFFIVAFAMTYILLFIYDDFSINRMIIYGIVISLVTTIAEATGGKGYDNLSIPLSALVCLYLLDNIVF